VAVRGVGKVYSTLLIDLVTDSRLKKYDLEAASEKAPKKKGALNIEGLAATPDGKLLVGFRNPQPKGKAIIVPIVNPREITEGQSAKLGPPIELDLSAADGNPLGIRSMEYHAGLARYVIIAGSFKAGGAFELFTWSGKPEDPPERMKGVDLADLTPEALVFWPQKATDGPKGAPSRRVQLLSDDGAREVGGVECKLLKDPSARSFRTAWLTLE
jgi:hypothetical protein